LELMEEWYRQYGLDVFNYLVYRMGTRDVDDLVQETFIRALQGVHHFSGDASPKTWLISIARNVANGFYRKKHRSISSEPLFDMESTERPIEKLIDSMDAKRVIERGLGTMRPSYVDVVILRGVMDLSVSEAAEALGWSESKVRVTWHRALKKLRVFLEGEGTWDVSIQE
jgi:RNA polymerase sigma-70 factor, ECF subfamily